jgi:hypothetical protein
VLTNIATGWTECAPLLVREQGLLVEVLTEMREHLPFAILGFDTDNDSVFMNETVQKYCRGRRRRVHPLSPVSQERSGLGRAEERLGSAPHGWLSAVRRLGGRGHTRPSLYESTVVRELLPTLV